MKSIITDEPNCYICGSYTWIEMHHVFGASNRKISDREGLIVPLCHYCHNEKSGVHHNKELNLKLKSECQKIWQRKNNKTKKDFITLFGRNYI